MGVQRNKLFNELVQMGLLKMDGDKKILDTRGFDAGGRYTRTKKHLNYYIVWPPRVLKKSLTPSGIKKLKYEVTRTISTMTDRPIEISRELGAEYPDYIVFVQVGCYLEVYDEDAYTCSEIFGWKVVDRGQGFEFTGVGIDAFRFK